MSKSTKTVFNPLRVASQIGTILAYEQGQKRTAASPQRRQLAASRARLLQQCIKDLQA